MKKLLALLLLFGIASCSISPKKLDELSSDNSYWSPAQSIKCMQMATPTRPHPINKKGEIRESYDQDDCYEDLMEKNVRVLTLELDKPSIDLKDGREIKKVSEASTDSINDIDIAAIEEKVMKNKKKKED
jgi:hypothetical protein